MDDNRYINLDRARFRLFLEDLDDAEVRHISEIIQTVCVSVYGELGSFEVTTLSELNDDRQAWDTPILPALLRVSPRPEKRYFGDLIDSNRLHNLLVEDRAELAQRNPPRA
ncbi:MAG: hypothetical protein CMN28_04495 [Salinisphaeraceae bacterium]|jgi:hypothetical protein|nr:hypothetical protein [Salinisphaeraceae bacterium]